MAGPAKWAMYVDGYNFYYAIKSGRAKIPLHLGWCDFGRLAREIIGDRGVLSKIKYFTAPVEDLGKSGGEGGSERARQAIWLRAVRTIPQLEVIEGFHNPDQPRESVERKKWRTEKETDVNIALALVLDAAKHVYDRAILLSGDYDQMPTVRALTDEWARRVEVWLPPGQALGRWSAFGDNPLVTVHHLTADLLSRSRLRDSIPVTGGTIEAPKSWRAP
jgi:hypothetical protein